MALQLDALSRSPVPESSQSGGIALVSFHGVQGSPRLIKGSMLLPESLPTDCLQAIIKLLLKRSLYSEVAFLKDGSERLD